MDIIKLLSYTKKPALFDYGTSVMWTDPYISKKLLQCHLDTGNDLASRQPEKISNIVKWISNNINTQKINILDLGCGPGLYTEKYASLGHKVTGIDFSENSISYAIKEAKRKNLDIEYICQNYLTIDYKDEFDLVTLIYMDFCVLRPNERQLLLLKISRSLKKGGFFIFDVVNGKNIEEKVLGSSWDISEGNGFWKKGPYIALNMGYHYPEAKTFVNQHIVIDEHNSIESYLFWNFYYEIDDMKSILSNTGLRIRSMSEKLLPTGDVWNGSNVSFYIIEKE